MGSKTLFSPKNLAETSSDNCLLPDRHREIFKDRLVDLFHFAHPLLNVEWIEMNWSESQLPGCRTENDEMISSGWKPNEWMHFGFCSSTKIIYKLVQVEFLLFSIIWLKYLVRSLFTSFCKYQESQFESYSQMWIVKKLHLICTNTKLFISHL